MPQFESLLGRCESELAQADCALLLVSWDSVTNNFVTHNLSEVNATKSYWGSVDLTALCTVTSNDLKLLEDPKLCQAVSQALFQYVEAIHTAPAKLALAALTAPPTLPEDN
jgi:hypothetical protein